MHLQHHLHCNYENGRCTFICTVHPEDASLLGHHALLPFLARPLAATGIGYAVLVGWSRVYLGVHYPLDVLTGAGIGMAVGGMVLGTLLRHEGRAANGRHAATDVRAPGVGPGPPTGSPS
jgi:PAP2 superfamily